jgi:hypothetical protein
VKGRLADRQRELGERFDDLRERSWVVDLVVRAFERDREVGAS